MSKKEGLTRSDVIAIRRAANGEGRLILDDGRCLICGGRGSITVHVNQGIGYVYEEPCPVCREWKF